MSRPATAHICLDAFRHNYRVAKQLHGGNSMAVIKANAYGHGAVECAQAIEDEVDGFAVACLEEALQLRQAGIKNPILLLEGFFEAAELPEIVAKDLWIVIHAVWQVEILLAAKLTRPLHVWLKLDSGMHRLGLSPDEYWHTCQRLSLHINVASIVCMSHFANADTLNSIYTAQQIEVFHRSIPATHLPHPVISMANSAAILGCQEAQGDWSRPGIMLYGANPLSKSEIKLQPVMQLTSQIISIHMIQRGESIGYGSIFTADKETIVGVVACGYADGYPRAATGAPVAVDGVMTKVIGRVSMDMLFVDITDILSDKIGDPKIGSKVELWGNQVAANDVAKAAGTIAYELFCNTKRVQFRYSDN
jgi:alanine racemase